jgi:hypothetical protein
MFGLSVRETLDQRFQGLLHGELGPTGNTSTFATYVMRDGAGDTRIKGGHLTGSGASFTTVAELQEHIDAFISA